MDIVDISLSEVPAKKTFAYRFSEEQDRCFDLPMLCIFDRITLDGGCEHPITTYGSHKSLGRLFLRLSLDGSKAPMQIGRSRRASKGSKG